jgi:hypothetical protein
MFSRRVFFHCKYIFSDKGNQQSPFSIKIHFDFHLNKNSLFPWKKKICLQRKIVNLYKQTKVRHKIHETCRRWTRNRMTRYGMGWGCAMQSLSHISLIVVFWITFFQLFNLVFHFLSFLLVFGNVLSFHRVCFDFLSAFHLN